MCEFDAKAIEFFKKNINYLLYPIAASLIAGFILFNIQMMFETTKKQVEYFEKIKHDSELLFFKKYQLNEKKIENMFSLLKEVRKVFYKTINDNKDESKITIEYLNNIEKIYNKELSIKFMELETLQLTKEMEIGFLNEKIYNNILLLKIYSNNSLTGYEEELEKQLNSLDKMYSLLINHLGESINKLTNTEYIIKNLRTREDFKKLLMTFNDKKFEQNLNSLTKRSNEFSKRIKDFESKMIYEINNRINGNIFEKIPYLFESKVKLNK